MPSRERVVALFAMVEQGRFVEAIEDFYTEDATMQENGEPPRGGRDRLDGDQAVIRWTFVFTRHDGRSLRMEELALQRWRGDRIAEERFFYDPEQTRRLSDSPPVLTRARVASKM